MSERPPEWICGKRVSIRASMRSTSRRLVTEALVDMAARPTFVIWHHYETFLSFPPVSQNRNPRMTPMQHTLRLMFAAMVAVALMHFNGVAAAQNADKQIKLTEKQIEGFISAQKEMSAMAEKFEKMQSQSKSDKPDPKLQAELESVAKKHGFASFEE